MFIALNEPKNVQNKNTIFITKVSAYVNENKNKFFCTNIITWVAISNNCSITIPHILYYI